MARKKISEFRVKSLLYQSLGIPYSGISYSKKNSALGPQAQPRTASFAYSKKSSAYLKESSAYSLQDRSKLEELLDTDKYYVVKVDEGVKRRFKKGLVELNVGFSQVQQAVKKIAKVGYESFLIEPYIEHKSADERYLAIERVREGYQVYYFNKGGIDVEQNADSVNKQIIPFYSSREVSPKADESRSNYQHSSRQSRTINEVANYFNMKVSVLEKLFETFDLYYFSFLELNPFIILSAGKASHDSQFIILDAAVEVDSAAEFFVDGAWTSSDFVEGEVRQKTIEEKNIEELSSKSQASFKLDVLNPNGSIFMLLSGGGASIVLADEVANLGKGKDLANYGEYSGNPSGEETYIYTKNLLSLLLKSNTKKKVLLIAGGVANFTDVRITFRGIIKALTEVKDKLYRQKVKVFVRRGGPYQKEGLALMKEFLQKEKLFGEVVGPEMVLTDIVKEALGYLK